MASAFVFNLITEIEYDNGAVGVWIQSDNVTVADLQHLLKNSYVILDG